MIQKCKFCNLQKRETIIAANKYFIAIYDLYPVSQGHILIISRRHIQNIFELNTSEFRCLHSFILKVKSILDTKFTPDGYNVGTNCGISAGQTIKHFHIHFVPRYVNDMRNPRDKICKMIKESLRAYPETSGVNILIPLFKDTL